MEEEVGKGTRGIASDGFFSSVFQLYEIKRKKKFTELSLLFFFVAVRFLSLLARFANKVSDPDIVDGVVLVRGQRRNHFFLFLFFFLRTTFLGG